MKLEEGVMCFVDYFLLFHRDLGEIDSCCVIESIILVRFTMNEMVEYHKNI